jgi:hypothetical protein
MHYFAVVSHLVLRGGPLTRIRARTEQGSAEAPHLPAAPGAWRNWWSMPVVEEPPAGARQTRVVGARGRVVPLH